MCGADQGGTAERQPFRGSPPRVRSRLAVRRDRARHHGITSACAEQTPTMASCPALRRDHLRVCGADSLRPIHHRRAWGSPPRVRSRQHDDGEVQARPGITSACAEQTTVRPTPRPHAEDHLRVCGADFVTQLPGRVASGSPPRVRSRRHVVHIIGNVEGITSACAEQTSASSNIRSGHSGSPPRVRSRHPLRVGFVVPFGITSACAEQTALVRAVNLRGPDHLRVCGADTLMDTQNCLCEGSPPRVRSRQPPPASSSSHGGITSACAEQTTIIDWLHEVDGDHLRVCGADAVTEWDLICCGITSACAEQTAREESRRR